MSTVACIILIGAVVSKAIDYVWTAYDVYQSGNVMADPNASQEDKLFASLNIAVALVFEAAEPDDILPVGLPLDDVGRRAVLKGAREAFEAGGMEAFEKYLRESLGKYSDEVLDNLCLGGNCAPSGVCFEAGTKVSTPNGSRSIEDIKIGDKVYGLDPLTGIPGIFTVTEVFSRVVQTIVEIKIGNDLIRTTEEHPFWVEGQGWIRAINLHPGDCIISFLGSCQPVRSVNLVRITSTVYNFSVDRAHTYYVGKGKWLVHNNCSALTAGGRRKIGNMIDLKDVTAA